MENSGHVFRTWPGFFVLSETPRFGNNFFIIYS
nr:MAG TPA: hypothetical protein [Caudoviricetes sp.]